jgi:hypothetical protein
MHPFFCLEEAKHRTIAEVIPQAFAEMYAAQIFNEKHKRIYLPFMDM